MGCTVVDQTVSTVDRRRRRGVFDGRRTFVPPVPLPTETVPVCGHFLGFRLDVVFAGFRSVDRVSSRGANEGLKSRSPREDGLNDNLCYHADTSIYTTLLLGFAGTFLKT